MNSLHACYTRQTPGSRTVTPEIFSLAIIYRTVTTGSTTLSMHDLSARSLYDKRDAPLLQRLRQADSDDEKNMFASLGGSVRPRTLCSWVLASQLTRERGTKINLIIDYHRSDISEIKLKRTDTTLDLSQKAKRAEERRGGWGKT